MRQRVKQHGLVLSLAMRAALEEKCLSDEAAAKAVKRTEAMTMMIRLFEMSVRMKTNGMSQP